MIVLFLKNSTYLATDLQGLKEIVLKLMIKQKETNSFVKGDEILYPFIKFIYIAIFYL